MAKRFKLRFSRVIASFHSCRSKDLSTLPENPIPSFFPSHNSKSTTTTTKHITLDFPLVNNNSPPSSTLKRHVSEFKWRKEEKFHVFAKIYDDVAPRQKISSSEDSDHREISPFPPPPFTLVDEKKKSRVKKKKTKTRLRMSNSSAEDCGTFSSETNWDGTGADYNEKEEETETLVSSSRSCFDLSSDSSTDFNPHLETICETTTMRRHKRRISTKRRIKHSRPSFSSSKGRRSSVSTTSSDSELPARLSVFQKLIPCSVDGKVKESFAIVKRSEDPYEDFKRSMMEMILEKQMYEKNELEQLLQCFLSLNGKHYHGVIVEAFSEIWETLILGNDGDRAKRLLSHPSRRRTVF